MDLGATIKRLRRAEFIGDGLGVYVGPHELGLVHLSKGLFRVGVREVQSVPLPGTEHPAERRHVLTDAVLGFVRAGKLGAAPAVLALHRSFALFNRIVLPAAAADNLREVVEYEIERVIPIPKSELYYDFTMRSFGAERIEVLVMCLPQVVVREHLDALEDAFLRPRGVVVSSAAVADFFYFCRESASGPVGFLFGTNGDLEFTLLADQQLVSSVVLPSSRTQGEDDVARLVSRELTDALVGLADVALYTAGPSNGSGPLMGADQLLPLAQDRLDAPAEFFENNDVGILPAVGAALGAVREGTVSVNLLPAEFRFGEEGSRWLLSAVLAVVLVLTLVAWGVSVVARDAMVQADLDEALTHLEPQVERLKKLEAESAALRKRITAIAGERDRHAIDYLFDVTTILPDDAYLTTFRLRNEQIQLDGFARASSELIPKLEESGRFKNVKFASPTTKAQGKDRFSISMELE
jgi:Tfp pilus assembly protein PilN